MKLSIITVNYNNKEGLKKTVNSVLSQTYHDFEWIIIDGGSTDGSKEIIEQIKDNLAFWCSEPDKGIYNAMNKGIAKSKGDFVNFMNSGDCYFEKDTLEKVFMEGVDADIIYGDWVKYSKGKEFVVKSPNVADLDFFFRHTICHQAQFIKTENLKNNGYDESFKIYADWVFCVQLLLKGATTQYVEIPICVYDMSGVSSHLNDDMWIENTRRHGVFPENTHKLLSEKAILKARINEMEQVPLFCDLQQLVFTHRLFYFSIKVYFELLKLIKKVFRF